MQHVLVFSTSALSANFSDVTIAGLLQRSGLPATGKSPNWLAPGQAAEMPYDNLAVKDIAALRQIANAAQIDVNMIAAGNRRKTLLLADMDSTIINGESLDEMAAIVGLGDVVADITARSMNGELDFEAAIDARVAMFAGQSASLFEATLAAIRLTAGARTLVQTMRYNKGHCYLVSSGFTPIAAQVANLCGFHAAHANEMIISNGVITGKVKKPILGSDSKAQILKRYCHEHELDFADTVAIGDGANDITVLKAAGMGVAFNSKAMLRKAIDLQLNHTDLTGLLFLQGYRATDFICNDGN